MNLASRVGSAVGAITSALNYATSLPRDSSKSPARGYLRRIFSIALPLASSSMSLSR